MPNYPYRCMNCNKKFEVFMSYADYGKQPVTCPVCHSENVQRVITKARIARSEESRIENLIDPNKLSGLEDDPQALGKLMKQMGSEMGEELGPEFDEVVDRLEAGQSPEEIEQAIPDVANDTGSPDFGL